MTVWLIAGTFWPSVARAQQDNTSPFGTGANLLAYRSVPTPEYRLPESTPETLELWRHFHNQLGFPARQDTQVVRDAYIEILDRWGRTAGVGEVQLLTELEFRLYDNDRCYNPDQFEVAQFLSIDTPGSILPVALLHLQAWQLELQNGRYSRLQANGKRIERLTRLHVRSLNETPEARRESASLLTYFAELVWEAGFADLLDVGLSALDTALDLDPEHVAGRYLRALIYEKQGFYRKALKDLTVLSRMLPEQGDITLRRAVQLERRGRENEARDLLDALIARRDLETWVRIVAYQERVRLSLDAEQTEEAGRLLQQAQGDYPENFRLTLMEIELDRRTSRDPDPRSRSHLDLWSRDAGPAPRLHYLQSPIPEMDANRHSLSGYLKPEALARAAKRAGFHDFGPSTRCAGLWRDLLPKGAGQDAGQGPGKRPDRPAAKPASTPQSRRSPAQPIVDSPNPERPISESTAITTAATGGPSPIPQSPSVASTGPTVYIDETTGERIRVDDSLDLELQQIYVTPSRFGRKGFRLEASQLDLFDDGRRQEIVTFEQGDIPFTATLLVDASGSMKGSRLRHALAGAKTFMESMLPLDQARLLIAADRVQGVSAFVRSSDASAADLADRLEETSAEGGTALFDHLFLAIDALEPELGRKVIILLSDGYDVMSVVPMESVRQAMRRSQTQLYWVRLRENPRSQFTPFTGWRPVGETREELALLERAVTESSGDILDIQRTDQVGEAFGEILNDLRRQIAVGYYASPSYDDGRWRDVKVKADGLGVKLRHASGYFDH